MSQSAADAIRELLARNPELGINGDVSATVEQRDPLEHAEQVAVVNWAREHEAQWPELELLYAVPNGGYRHPATAANMKAEGQRAGIPDLCLPVSRRMSDGTVYHALYIEMKRIGGKPTADQTETIRKLQGYGNLAVICFGARDGIETLEFYLNERG